MAFISGGGSPFFNDAVADTVVAVKQVGPAQILGMKLVNTTDADAYLQIFNIPAGGVTLGTTPATFTVHLISSESVWMGFSTPLAISAAGNPLTVSASGINGTGGGMSIAGTTTATGDTGAAISVSMIYL